MDVPLPTRPNTVDAVLNEQHDPAINRNGPGSRSRPCPGCAPPRQPRLAARLGVRAGPTTTTSAALVEYLSPLGFESSHGKRGWVPRVGRLSPTPRLPGHADDRPSTSVARSPFLSARPASAARSERFQPIELHPGRLPTPSALAEAADHLSRQSSNPRGYWSKRHSASEAARVPRQAPDVLLVEDSRPCSEGVICVGRTPFISSTRNRLECVPSQRRNTACTPTRKQSRGVEEGCSTDLPRGRTSTGRGPPYPRRPATEPVRPKDGGARSSLPCGSASALPRPVPRGRNACYSGLTHGGM